VQPVAAGQRSPNGGVWYTSVTGTHHPGSQGVSVAGAEQHCGQKPFVSHKRQERNQMTSPYG
jgi:hypothetical protein